MPLSLQQIREWVHRIDAERMPKPVWISGDHVFEYEEVTVDIVAFLKIVRATQSLHALPVLADNGLLTDFGSIVRPIIECVEDVLFLLERYPEMSNDVCRFVEHFRETTISGIDPLS